MTEQIDCTVIIGTFGDETWKKRGSEALQRVMKTPFTVEPNEGRWHHGATLAASRNKSAELCDSEWLCFVDADDELDPRFFEAMQPHIEAIEDRDALLWPFYVRHFSDGSRSEPMAPPHPNYCDLRAMNWMVIGTLVRRDTFMRAGGFGEWRAWEDWALWMRCAHLGASPLKVGRARYIQHVDDEGRNSTVQAPEKLRRDILRDYDAWVAAQ